MKQLSYLIALLLLMQCKTKPMNTYQPVFKPGPPLLVYKTKKDYSHFVPVRMDSTHSIILSYPAPSDVLRDGKPLLPTALDKGYWLDNIGISKDVAYLKLTLEEYSKLNPEKITDEFLLASILDKEPLLELWYGGVKVQSADLIEKLRESTKVGLEKSSFKKLNK
ncbi:MAG: hypothetical protein LCH37_12140 [Bacteroidetes bacterium]|nr:hypothetical protein [Bacteroidota bacterium]